VLHLFLADQTRGTRLLPDGELIHMTSYNEQSQATRRRRETTYQGHTVRLFCYPLIGRWRPVAIVEYPGRVGSTRLGHMILCDSARRRWHSR
jgi:hypothetical protein